MIIAILTAAMASAVTQPGATVDFTYDYPGFYAGSSTFTITAVEDETAGPECTKGWALPYCLTGTYTTSDGGTGTFTSWADKSNSAANDVDQFVEFVDGNIGTIFTGTTTITQSGSLPLAGDIVAVWPDPDVYGTWVETAPPATLRGAPASYSRGNR